MNYQDLINEIDAYEYQSEAKPEDTAESNYETGISEGVRIGESNALKKIKAMILRSYADALENSGSSDLF